MTGRRDPRDVAPETVRALVQQAVDQGHGEQITDTRIISALRRIARSAQDERAAS